MDKVVSPYEILGIPFSATVTDIRRAFKRLALRTHPDKQVSNSHQEENIYENISLYPFHLIKEASDFLLDPLSRAKYDQKQKQEYIRFTGVVSDTYNLNEFDLVDENPIQNSKENENVNLLLRVYALECRCGGSFEVFVIVKEGEKQEIDKRCECDCCSLVISVRG